MKKLHIIIIAIASTIVVTGGILTGVFWKQIFPDKNSQNQTQAILTSIAVSGSNYKVDYGIGEPLSVANLYIVPSFSDGTKGDKIKVEKEWVVGFDSSVRATQKPISVTYNDLSATYHINVHAPVTAIAVDSTEHKKRYPSSVTKNDIDVAGLTVKMSYADDSFDANVPVQKAWLTGITTDANGAKVGIAYQAPYSEKTVTSYPINLFDGYTLHSTTVKVGNIEAKMDSLNGNSGETLIKNAIKNYLKTDAGKEIFRGVLTRNVQLLNMAGLSLSDIIVDAARAMPGGSVIAAGVQRAINGKTDVELINMLFDGVPVPVFGTINVYNQFADVLVDIVFARLSPYIASYLTTLDATLANISDIGFEVENNTMLFEGVDGGDPIAVPFTKNPANANGPWTLVPDPSAYGRLATILGGAGLVDYTKTPLVITQKDANSPIIFTLNLDATQMLSNIDTTLDGLANGGLGGVGGGLGGIGGGFGGAQLTALSGILEGIMDGLSDAETVSIVLEFKKA